MRLHVIGIGKMGLPMALHLQAGAQVPLPLTALTRQFMGAALAQGHEEDDYAAIIRVAERSAGLD